MQPRERGGTFTTFGNDNSRHFSSGFTLLEILIALFIFAVILTTIFTSYTGTVRVVDETESQADIYRMAGIAMQRMVEDLESLYVPNGVIEDESEDGLLQPLQFLGEDREIEGRPADILRFTSMAHIDFGGQDQGAGAAEIGYYVRAHDDGEGLALYRRDRTIFEQTFPSEEETGGLVLCERLASVNFTYYEENGEVRESWDSTSDEGKDRIPAMVSISLEFPNSLHPEVPFKFLTRVALPREKAYPW